MEMEQGESGGREQRWMRLFGVAFLVSVGLALALSGTPGRALSEDIADDPRIALSIALVTAATSLVGFVSTTWLAWRKERREGSVFRLQVERQQLEIERLKLELAAEREKVGKL